MTPFSALLPATITILGLLTPVELTDLPLASFVVTIGGGADSFFDGGLGGRDDVKVLRLTSLLLARWSGEWSDVFRFIAGLREAAALLSPALVDL